MDLTPILRAIVTVDTACIVHHGYTKTAIDLIGQFIENSYHFMAQEGTEGHDYEYLTHCGYRRYRIIADSM